METNRRRMTRRKNYKLTNPWVENIKKELCTVSNEIGHLHKLKENCRSFRYKPKPNGKSHCLKCGKWTLQQNLLRERRKQLINEMVRIS